MNFTKCYTSFAIYFSFFVLSSFLTIPPFLNGYFIGHDTLYHLNWNELFQTQLFQGDLYPRWLFDMKGGRGSPVFYFYSPLPYYCSSLFSLLIPTSQNVWYSLGATYCFALAISALGMFWFLRTYTEDKYAYAFTIFYILFPYHVVVDLYIRFAFTEFFAIAWVPYLFIFARRLAEGHKSAIYFLAIFYSLLLLSHIPTTLLITPFVVAFGLIHAKTSLRKYSILAGLTLGGALSAFYILPIFFLREFVSIERMMTGRFFYESSFLHIGNIFNNSNDLFLNFLEKLSLISLIIAISGFFAANKNDKNIIFYFISSLFCIVMMYPLTQILWEILPILQIVQFPWRFFIIISFTLFWGAAYSVRDQNSKNTLSRYFAYLVITILISTSTMTVICANYQWTKSLENKDMAVITKPLISRDGTLEYLPASTPSIYYEQISNMKLQRVKELFVGVQKAIKSEYAFVGDHILVKIDNQQAQTILFNQFYFPTWESYNLNDNSIVGLKRSKEGLLEFKLSKGIHRLRFAHKRTLSEMIGLIITLLTGGYILFRLTVLYKNNR